ncbi:MAG TPA: hypothetical protein VFW44_11500 [Bryobacteraceae bacterium]|nr:hypothetical protein [Bryobacteraceae bacterium]
MKPTIYLLLAGLVLSTGVAKANKIHVAGSIYGDATGHPPVSCSSATCDVEIPGATMTEQLIPFSFVGGYVDFYFNVSGASSYTLTLTGDQDFISDDTVTDEYFGFGVLSCPGGTAVPPCSTADQSPGASDGNENSVTFTIPSAGDGLTFFVVEPGSLNTDGVPSNKVTATLTAITPEPATWPVLAIAFCAVIVALQRKRSAKAA